MREYLRSDFHHAKAIAMNVYETSATVDADGQLRLAGVPFAPGTEVEVIVNAKPNGEQAPAVEADRITRLFAALDKARNVQPIGTLKRDELYDRDVLH